MSESAAHPGDAGSEHAWYDGLRLLREEASNLVKTIPGPIAGVSLHAGGCSLEITWPQQQPQQHPQAHAAVVAVPPDVAAPGRADPRDDGLQAVVAPLVGTFYAAPEPGREPFVSVGDRVSIGETVGIVEAMKLMNPVVAEWAGEVVDVCVGDAEPVEYDQVLIRIRVDEP